MNELETIKPSIVEGTLSNDQIGHMEMVYDENSKSAMNWLISALKLMRTTLENTSAITISSSNDAIIIKTPQQLTQWVKERFPEVVRDLQYPNQFLIVTSAKPVKQQAEADLETCVANHTPKWHACPCATCSTSSQTRIKEKFMTDSTVVDAAHKRELEHLRKVCALPALCVLALFFLPTGSPWWLAVVLWLAAFSLQTVCGVLVWRTASRLQRSGWIWAAFAMGLGPLGPLIAFARLDALADSASMPVRQW